MIRRPLLCCAAALLFCASAAAQDFNYAEAMQKGLFFYEAQRSGALPADNEVIWRGDSALNDGADAGVDLTGGWYDAGDHVKFGLPMASTAATLSWAVYEYGDAMQLAGLKQKTLENIKWATDYFIKAHPSPNVFYYQVGDGNDDHTWWGPAEVIEEVMDRPSFAVTESSPGSTVTAATAAALAAASVIFESSDPAYAAQCLSHARELFDFAYNTQSDAGYDAATGFYDSFSGFWDEITAAATWLYLKTGETNYLTLAESSTTNWGTDRKTGLWGYEWTHSWDDMHYMAALLLARITGKQVYIDAVERNLDYWQPGGGITYTPGGLAWLDQWGSLRYAANASFLAFVWADTPLGDTSKKPAYRSFAESQINYMLGDNPANRSYVIGFGNNPPVNPHHRTAHGAWYNDIKAPADNRHILFGALVGGPDQNDSYTDDRTDYQQNEVATDYNAAFYGALARMYESHGGSALADFPDAHFKPESQRLPDYLVRAIVLSEDTTSTTILTQTSNRSAWPAAVRDDFTYRYFFDISEALAAGYSIDDFSVSPASGEAGSVFGPLHRGGNVYYVEADLTGTKIYPAGRSESERTTEFTINAPADVAWDPSNDWSRQGLGTNFTYEPVDMSGATEFIPLYAGGTLVWGQEPSADGEPPPPADHPDMWVADIALSLSSKGPWTTAEGRITVVDENGAPVDGAEVSVSWSGLVSGSDSAATGSNGVATLSSPRTRNSGTITVAVDGVNKAGMEYVAGSNVESSDSINVP